MATDDGAPPVAPRRDAIAYHEAGHAVVGHARGLRFSRIYIGDASGQVAFDDQWSDDAVLGDADLLDRYVLMLLGGAAAEWRRTGTVVGATGDVAALVWLLRQARRRGTVPRPDRWRRADAETARCWSAIATVAAELTHRSRPAARLAGVLARYPELGASVDELSAVRVRELLGPDGPAGATVADHAPDGG